MTRILRGWPHRCCPSFVDSASAPPTGFGSVPRDHEDTRFLLARGYRLEQVERASRLALPVEGLVARLAAAQHFSGAD